jgi:hypothetical protein
LQQAYWSARTYDRTEPSGAQYLTYAKIACCPQHTGAKFPGNIQLQFQGTTDRSSRQQDHKSLISPLSAGASILFKRVHFCPEMRHDQRVSGGVALFIPVLEMREIVPITSSATESAERSDEPMLCPNLSSTSTISPPAPLNHGSRQVQLLGCLNGDPTPTLLQRR